MRPTYYFTLLNRNLFAASHVMILKRVTYARVRARHYLLLLTICQYIPVSVVVHWGIAFAP